MRRSNAVGFAIISAMFISALALVLSLQARAANGPTHWGPDYFPNVALITQDGKTVHFYDDLLKDKIVAIDLIYTHCQDQCPLETARMAQVQRMLGDRVGKDIFFYSITIDPKRDTPEVLKAYAEKFHAGPGWLFLTGKPDDIALISKKIGLYSDPDPSDRDGHTAELMIGDVAAGSWMRNSATDNPRFLATMIGEFLSGYKNRRTQGVQTVSAPQPLHLKSSGEYLFATRCTACHTIGHGDKIGPDLLGVTNVRDRAWLIHFIQKPDDLLSTNDPIASALFTKYNRIVMPNLRLGPDDVIALVNYLQDETAGNGKSVSVSGQAPAPAQQPANTSR